MNKNTDKNTTQGLLFSLQIIMTKTNSFFIIRKVVGIDPRARLCKGPQYNYIKFRQTLQFNEDNVRSFLCFFKCVYSYIKHACSSTSDCFAVLKYNSSPKTNSYFTLQLNVLRITINFPGMYVSINAASLLSARGHKIHD